MKNKMNEIIRQVRDIHRENRLTTGDVSSHTKSAQKITKQWQSAVASKGIKCEVKVSENNNEKIDVVDSSTAYELKVSGKNVQHEFYKDVAKVMTYNENYPTKITKIVFISEKVGISSLRNRLDPKYLSLLRDLHKLEVNLVGI